MGLRDYATIKTQIETKQSIVYLGIGKVELVNDDAEGAFFAVDVSDVCTYPSPSPLPLSSSLYFCSSLPLFPRFSPLPLSLFLSPPLSNISTQLPEDALQKLTGSNARFADLRLTAGEPTLPSTHAGVLAQVREARRVEEDSRGGESRRRVEEERREDRERIERNSNSY